MEWIQLIKCGSLEEHLLPNTKEKEIRLKDNLGKKGSLSIKEYVRRFKSICDNLAAINKPMADVDKVFQLAGSLGLKYQDFHLAMLAYKTSLLYF